MLEFRLSVKELLPLNSYQAGVWSSVEPKIDLILLLMKQAAFWFAVRRPQHYKNHVEERGTIEIRVAIYHHS